VQLRTRASIKEEEPLNLVILFAVGCQTLPEHRVDSLRPPEHRVDSLRPPEHRVDSLRLPKAL
jgi:hypothetical protein